MNITGIGNSLKELLEELGLNNEMAIFFKGAIIFLLIIAIALLADYITKKIIIQTLKTIIHKSKNQYDDILLKNRVFNKLAHIVPALIIHYTIHLAIPNSPGLIEFIQNGIYIYILLVVVLVINSLFNALHEIYLKFPISEDIPIKGYIQVVKIIIYVVTGILVLAIVFDKSPLFFLGGMGAAAAIIMLIFRDTILGFVASIQLTAYKMLKPGDWISMPGHNADGIVTDLSLSIVKVENWDKTVTTIPTYALISESFVNWENMLQSEGRRIKRNIHVDMKSINFFSANELAELQKQPFLEEFFQTQEARDVLKEHKDGKRFLINITLFRLYVDWYIKHHPKLHTGMLNVVRHLQTNEHGLPLEIMVFSKEKALADYERIQAELFEHLMAIANSFNLRVFQNPTGDDIKGALNRD